MKLEIGDYFIFSMPDVSGREKLCLVVGKHDSKPMLLLKYMFNLSQSKQMDETRYVETIWTDQYATTLNELDEEKKRMFTHWTFL